MKINNACIFFLFFVSGINSPDFGLYESSKLLSSLLVTIIGKTLYASSSTSETRFIDQGVTFPTLTLTADALRKPHNTLNGVFVY